MHGYRRQYVWLKFNEIALKVKAECEAEKLARREFGLGLALVVEF